MTPQAYAENVKLQMKLVKKLKSTGKPVQSVPVVKATPIPLKP